MLVKKCYFTIIHLRGWITIPGFPSKKKWNSTGWFCPPPPSPSRGVGIRHWRKEEKLEGGREGRWNEEGTGRRIEKTQEDETKKRTIAILPHGFDDRTSLHAKGLPPKRTIAISPQVLTIELHFVRKGCRRSAQIAIFLQLLAIEPHFVRKGCRRGC